MVHRKEHFRTIVLVYCALLFCTIVLCLSSPALSQKLTEEDGLIESIGAVSFLLASLTFFTAALRQKKGRFRLWWFLLLALFCFLAFGEEISWGQRLIGFDSPNFFLQWNFQKETNIHNMAWISGFDEKGQDLPWWGKILTAGRMFTLASFTFCVFIPIGVSRCSWLAEKTESWRLPRSPLVLSWLFLTNYCFFRLALLFQNNQVHDLNEIKEAWYALAWLIVAISIWKKEKTAPSTS